MPGRRWSPDDLRRLTSWWGVVPLRQVARDLGRTEGAVRAQGYELDLPTGVESGYLSLHQAAQRAGYHHISFRRAVEWYEARGHHVEWGALPTVRRSQRSGQWRQIDAEDAATIAAAYAASELPGQASARLGVSAITLRRRARAAGYTARPARLMPSEWDALASPTHAPPHPTKGPKKCPAP